MKGRRNFESRISIFPIAIVINSPLELLNLQSSPTLLFFHLLKKKNINFAKKIKTLQNFINDPISSISATATSAVSCSTVPAVSTAAACLSAATTSNGPATAATRLSAATDVPGTSTATTCLSGTPTAACSSISAISTKWSTRNSAAKHGIREPEVRIRHKEHSVL